MSMMNPRGMVNRSNQIGRVNEKKNRDFWSNNLPFREANGLAPDLPLQFLWPTGTEAGGYWDFGNSGFQYESGVLSGAYTRVTSVGQAVAAQLDSRISPVAHSVILTLKTITYGGTGANTISVGSNAVFLNMTATNDYVDFNGGNEFSGAELARCEVVYKVEGISGGSLLLYAGNGGIDNIAADGVYYVNAYNTPAGSGFLRVYARSGPVTAKVTVLSITGYPGNHLSQATTTARPISAIETVGTWGQSVYSGRFDSVDDSLTVPIFAAGTLTANMDFFGAIKRNGNGTMVLMANGPSPSFNYIGDASPDPSTASGVGGAYSVLLDGQPIVNTGTTLRNALSDFRWHVLEYQNLDMSAWTQIYLGGYAGYMLDANLGAIVLCPAQSVTNRELARRIIGASVGLLI